MQVLIALSSFILFVPLLASIKTDENLRNVQLTEQQDKEKNLGWKLFTNVNDPTTEKQRNFITKYTKMLTDKLDPFTDKIPLSITLVVLEQVKSILHVLPLPYRWLVSGIINELIKYLIIRNEQLKEKNSQEADLKDFQTFFTKHKNLFLERFEMIIDGSGKKLENSYLVPLDMVLDSYVDECKEDTKKFDDLIKYLTSKIEKIQNLSNEKSEEMQNAHGERNEKIQDSHGEKKGDLTVSEKAQNFNPIFWCYYKIKNLWS